jgi:trimeric autotransporter adhesin
MDTLKKILGGALVALSLNAFAGDCPALSGQLTIGKAEGSDYATINEAITALKCGGVSGPVTFFVETGNYNERLVISSIPGTSAINTVTFEAKSGSNTDAVISYASSDATLILNGASFVSFENITIDHKTATYGNCVRVEGKATHLHFKSVIFEGVEVARTGANSATIYFAPSAPKSNIAFEDCDINNGSDGIIKGGSSADMRDTKTSITGTLFFNQYESALVLANEDAPVITSNVVTSLSNYKEYQGLSLENISNNVIISNNIVTAANGSAGLAMKDCVADAANMGQITNNSIAVGGSGQTYGVYLTGSTDNQILNFNRIKLTVAGKVEGKNQAYYKNAASGNNINMANNILYDLNTGGYTIIGNEYKDIYNQLPAQSNPALSVSANGIMIEKVTPVR